MPQVAAAAVVWWAAYGTYVTYALLAYSAYQANRQRRRARQRARDEYNASLQDRLAMVATADGARSRLYGMTRNVDGIVFKAAHGANSEFYTLVVAIAGHECESIEKVYFNDQEVTLSSDGAGGWWVMTQPFMASAVESSEATMTTVGTTATVTLPHTPVSGSVSCYQFLGNDPEGGYPLFQFYTPSVVGSLVTCTSVDPAHTSIVCGYQYTVSVPKARVWKYLGTDIQDIGSDLLQSRFPSLINTAGNDDRFAGICALVVELEFDQDAFPTGVPQVSALVKGAKILDTRTGVTAWSQNPAMIARDWSLYQFGGGCSTSEIDEAAFIAAANACDVSTAFVTPAGTETRPLYQCDIVCKLDASPDQGWLAEMVESMAGKWGWAGGQLTLVAGVYRAPVIDITPEWVSKMADVGIVKDVPLSEVVNVYRPTIADADAPVDGGNGTTAAYAMASMPEVRSAAYIAVDGLELTREVTLSGVTHNVHAQHICAVMMRDARYGMTISLPCKMIAWQLELFDVVRVTLPVFGLVAAEFEVVGWQYSVDNGVVLTLKKIDASIFDVAGNFELPNADLNTSLVLPWVVPSITGLTVTDAPQDGTQQSRMLVTWDAVTSQSVTQSGQVEVQYTPLGDSLPTGDWPSWTEPGNSTQAIIPGLLNNTYYIVRARAVNTLRVRGPWCPQKLYSVGVPLIDTPQLAPGAATELFTQDKATLTQHGIDNIITYTATADCTVVLKVECIAKADQDVGPTGAVYNPRMSFGAEIADVPSSTVLISTVKTTRYVTIGNAPAEVRLTSIAQTTMNAGDEYSFGMRLVGDFFPDLDWTFTQGNTQLEVIKR